MYVCMYVCMYLCTYVFMYVCMYYAGDSDGLKFVFVLMILSCKEKRQAHHARGPTKTTTTCVLKMTRKMQKLRLSSELINVLFNKIEQIDKEHFPLAKVCTHQICA